MYNKKGWKYGKKVDGYLQINEIQRKMEKKWMESGKIICYEGNLEYTND